MKQFFKILAVAAVCASAFSGVAAAQERTGADPNAQERTSVTAAKPEALQLNLPAQQGTAQLAPARKYANEISVSYGPLSSSDLSGLIVTALVNLFDKNAHAKVSGTFSAEYYRQLGHLVSVGGSFAIYNMSGDKEGVTSNYTNYILMAGTRLRWYNRGWFASYSKVAAGVKYCDWGKDSRLFYPAFQVSLLGLEVGPRVARIFTEIGVGDQGLALAGIRCNF